MNTKSHSHNSAAIATRAALMLLSFAMCLQTAAAEEPEIWSWTESAGNISSVQINFVRGDVEIMRRPGPVIVEVQKTSPSGRQSSVSIIATETDTALEIIDRYPDKYWIRETECLPSMRDRGYFWDSDVMMKTRIWAPSETDITTHIMSGAIEYAPMVN